MIVIPSNCVSTPLIGSLYRNAYNRVHLVNIIPIILLLFRTANVKEFDHV